MAWQVVINGRTYTQANFAGNAYADEDSGLPAAMQDMVTHVATNIEDAKTDLGTNCNTTSTTSRSVGTGSKQFTVAAERPFAVGQFAMATDSADTANWVWGSVTAWDSGSLSLTINVTKIGGSGTKNAWNITVTGPEGSTTALSSPTLTGTMTAQTGAAIALDDSVTSAATTPLPIHFDGDTNTGRFRPAADTIADVAGGVEVLRQSAGLGKLTGNLLVSGGLTIGSTTQQAGGLAVQNAPSVAFNGLMGSWDGTWGRLFAVSSTATHNKLRVGTMRDNGSENACLVLDAGNLYLGVANGTTTTLQDATTYINGVLTPNSSNARDLGSTVAYFRDLYTKGVYFMDSDASHFMRQICGGNLTGHRTLSWFLGDANRSITVTADCTIEGNPVVQGIREFYIDAGQMIPAVTNGPQFKQTEASGDGSSNYLTLDFDQSTREWAWFKFRLPKSFAYGTAISYLLHWTADSGSGDVYVELGVGAISDNEVMTALSNGSNVTDTLQNASRLHTSAESSGIGPITGAAAGDLLMFRLDRIASNGADTLNADCRVIGVTLRVTVDKATDA